jgi:restriction system protein
VAEITAKRQGEIVQALFKILEQEEDGLQAKEAVTRTEGALTLTDFERDTFPNNPDVVRFPKILRFSTINVVKAGWLLKKSGTWTITDDGRAALAKYPDPEAFFRGGVSTSLPWFQVGPAQAASGALRVL